jgi:predicted outer membrane repeat protein
MKFYQYTFFLITLLGWSQTNAQVIYVNRAATGANNGTSWANAYTKLAPALAAANAPGRQVWVAAGTYTPDTTAWFMNPGTALYGGFVGTETALAQRNATTNATVLSGDVKGDDVAGNFTTNRADNARHVLWLRGSDTISRAVIDGFTIRNGQTLGMANLTTDDGRGGGILAQTKATIRNCRFTGHFGLNGAAISGSNAGASQVLIDNCVFEGNAAAERSVVHLVGLRSGEVNRCIFRNNIASRGVLYPQQCRGMVIDSCLVEGNRSSAFCAGIFLVATTVRITNCTSRRNRAADGVAILVNGNNEAAPRVLIDNCLFEKDTATAADGAAAAIYAFSGANCEVLRSVFRDNFARFGGGALFNDGAALTFRQSNFTNNTAQGAGGVLFAQENGTRTVFEDCTFSENKSLTRSGGALFCGFLSATTIRRCNFEKNQAEGVGGAIVVQNDSTKVTIEGSKFTENSAVVRGGALSTFPGPEITISTSTFNNNVGDFGGALDLGGSKADPTEVKISRCTFKQNSGGTQAGAININNTPNISITDCLFAENISSSAGGAISNNASGRDTSSIKAVNCTFVANVSGIGGGIAQYEANDTCQAILTLQNSIFANNIVENYLAEDGTPSVISLGGNLCAVDDMKDFLKGPGDANVVDPMFVAPDDGNYQLRAGSPCINTGIAAGAAAVDLLGIPRVGLPDKGCYEFQTVGVFQPVTPSLALQLAPSIVTDRTVLTLDHAWNGPVQISIFGQDGSLAHFEEAVKATQTWNHSIELPQLPAGLYRLVATMPVGRGERAFVKG